MNRRLKFLAGAASAACVAVGVAGSAPVSVDWRYNGGSLGDHYSPLTQIDATNVGQLKQAWRFDYEAGGLQAQPLVVDGVLYGPTPDGKLVALDGATGALKWTFDPGVEGGQPIRGLESHGMGGNMRLLFGSQNFLFAVDPRTGKAIASFGQGGRINISENLRGPAEGNAMFITSPGSVYRDVYIASGRVSESTPSSPGDIRAFDVRTGRLRWTFHTIPHPGEPGAETWPKNAHLSQGGANGWAGSVVDTRRGIVYFGTGSAADDFYGGERLGDNRFANSLIALNANTGKLIWDFQAVRHDLWDLDFNAPPVLLTVNRQGKRIDAIAASNKTSYLYILDRVTGEPLFPIVDTPVSPSKVPGETAAATQPVPTLPKPMSRVSITVNDLTDRTTQASIWARQVFAALNGGGKSFEPMAIGKDTLVFAGFTGGVGWGGMAADRRGVLYANVTDRPGISSIVESKSLLTAGLGERTYNTQCAACHGGDRKGIPPLFPGLTDLTSRLSTEAIAAVIKNGRGRMPGFGNLPAATINNLVAFLTTGADLPGTPQPAVSLQGRLAPSVTQYTSTGNRNFLDPDGYPGVKPPWGKLHAIDASTGQYLWTVPFGTTNDLGPQFGGPNTGGAVVSGSGLLFIGASADGKFHVYDSRTGKLLWETTLTAPAQATPAVYMVNGRQYVVVAASGRNAGPAAQNQDNAQAVVKGRASGGYIAFALPN